MIGRLNVLLGGFAIQSKLMAEFFAGTLVLLEGLCTLCGVLELLTDGGHLLLGLRVKL
jgi:hypothetical protein